MRHDRAKEVGAAAVGAGAGQGVYQQTGYSTKQYLDTHTRKGHVGVGPAQVRAQDKALKPLKSAHGMHLPKGDPGRDNAGFHRNYPKELPHGRVFRALGHTHEGRSGMALGAVATATGGAAALAVTHHQLKKKPRREATVNKSAFGIAKSDKSERRRGAKTGTVLGGAAVAAPAAAFHATAHGMAPMTTQGGRALHLGEAARLHGTTALLTAPAVAAGALVGRGVQRGIQRRKDPRAVVTKSAFGVYDARIAKAGFLTEALEGGAKALKGVKSGLGGEIGAAGSHAGATGKTIGAGARSAAGKLKPLVSTPGRAAATGGVGGIALGAKLKHGN